MTGPLDWPERTPEERRELRKRAIARHRARFAKSPWLWPPPQPPEGGEPMPVEKAS